MIGRTIGSYEVVAQLGAGGMGEVYRARDTKLGRDVALKVLPSDVAHDADRLARFRREAHVLASLNHRGIAHLYGVDDSTPQPVLVMELVEGSTLADQIARGPMSTDEAVPLAMQIAEAVEAAHESGIVHRDLKPANIKVRPDGHIKVLDFGLARAGSGFTSVDTLTVDATSPGTILGTAAYMAPEQAKGMTAGPQADIWAFGCVLFEMLTGRSAFARATFSETLANVISGAPDLDALPSNTPPLVRRVVRRCLEKDPRNRYHHMADARIDLADALSAPDASAPQPMPRHGAAWILPIVAASAIAAAAGTVGWWVAARGAVDPATPVRLVLPFVDPPRNLPHGTRHVAISRDGLRVAYAADSQLWVRRLQERDARSLGVVGANPFFSPDGQWVGAFTGEALVKIPTDGGSPTVLAENTDRPRGGAWLNDGTIVFATNAGLYRVTAEGGGPELIATPDREKGERLFASPAPLPGDRVLLFTVVTGDTKARFATVALDLSTKIITPVLDDASSATYHGTGHLVYTAGSALKAVAFDTRTVKTTGRPFDLPDADVAVASDNGLADFALSASGTLVFVPTFVQQEPRSLIWIDRNGVEQPLPVEARPYAYPRISPDGRRVALDVRGNNRDIWILDLERLTQVRLTDGPTEDMLPVWSRDGSRIFFASDRQGNFDVYSQPANGAAAPTVEYAAPGFQAPESFTPDGMGMVIDENFRATSLVHRSTSPQIEPLLHLDVEAMLGQISPDGKWMAYESKESGGNWEVYVRPFPRVNEGREKVSTAGGRYPLWNRTGSELYFLELDGDMMAASVTTSPAFRVLRLTTLFHWRPPVAGVSGRIYDVSPIDGRFLAPTAFEKKGQTQLSVVLNWTVELLRRERAAGLE